MYNKYIKEHRRLSTLSLKAYKIDLQQFEDCIGSEKPITAIDKESLTSFLDHLIQLELAPTSVKRKFACVRAMFRWLELEDAIAINPFNKFVLNLTFPKRLPKNVPRDDLRTMLSVARSSAQVSAFKADDSAIVQRKRDLNGLTALISLELMISTGVRVCELASLSLSNIFVSEGKVKIFGKGSRERFVYLPCEDTRKLVITYLHAREIAEPDNDSFLVNSRGKPASTQFIRKLIRQLSNEAKTQSKVTPHMLRHSAACELLEANVDIRFVQRLLGHSSISTTELYTHISDTALMQKISTANVRSRIMKK